MNPVQVVRLCRQKDFCIPMVKHKNARGGADVQKGTSPTPSSHRGETGDIGNAVNDLRDDVDSLEERISQMGIPSKMPFRFMQSS